MKVEPTVYSCIVGFLVGFIGCAWIADIVMDVNAAVVRRETVTLFEPVIHQLSKRAIACDELRKGGDDDGGHFSLEHEGMR